MMPTVPPNRAIREGEVPARRAPQRPPADENPGRDVAHAPRYRIVTNGVVFKAQRRGWFFWHDLEGEPWLGALPGQIRGTTKFQTVHVARRILDARIARDRESRGGWRVLEQ